MSFKFYTFNEITNLQRVNFIEIQYCKLKCRTSIIKKVSVNSIIHKQEDSLSVPRHSCFLLFLQVVPLFPPFLFIKTLFNRFSIIFIFYPLMTFLKMEYIIT